MSNFDPPPRISVILVTWNSAAYLTRCLGCLAAQTLEDFEVVLVDNGSTDGSLDGVESRWPGLTLRVERLDENRGFTAANNIGARMARGHWLALLNTDAFPDPDWLEKLLRAAERYPVFSFFASRQLQDNAPHLLDGAGDALHINGLAWRRYASWPAAQFGLEPEEVFSPCAAAALYSRRPFLQVSLQAVAWLIISSSALPMTWMPDGWNNCGCGMINTCRKRRGETWKCLEALRSVGES